MAEPGVTASVLNTMTTAVMGFTTSIPGTADVMKEGMKKMKEEDTLVDDLNFVMCGIVAPIFCFVGMAGNVLSIITWNRPKMRSSTGRYLTGQAIADFSVLMFFVSIDSVTAWNPDVKFSPVYGFCFCYILYPGLFFAVVCSVWFTVGVTIDRYILVCWITKAKQYCNEKRANFGLILITFNAFIINFPHYLSYTTVDPTSSSSSGNSSIFNTGSVSFNNGTAPGDDGMKKKTPLTTRVEAYRETEFYTSDSGQFYEFWIHCMILILIPWVTVFSMNVMIIKRVRESNKKNEGKKTSAAAKHTKQSENQITRLLLAVTFTFLVFIGMQCIIQCMYMKKPAGFNMFIVNSSFAVAKCGIVFNSSLNFFLYCLTGRRFRTELLTVLGLYDADEQLSSLMDRPSSGHTTSSTGSTGI
ncbi:FMRFamide receptor [Elysia marginata]|uniref:FMRFamide receptor n=1 Tax=Elysia marginata TaxID=1093978 RepID=A0AAV4HTR3_9GAST|nr:FMRFamide receptor [Elysia marginata]